MEEDNSNNVGSISPDELRNQIEAILFASGKKLDVQFIKDITGVDNIRKVKNALEKIKKWYDENNNILMITQEGDQWKINVRENYLDVVRKIVSETDLSKAILETLSVIAWKSPVYQSEVITIRGAGAYEQISSLQESGFISKEKEGRSYILKVTNKFFEYFDIEGNEGIRDIFKKIKEKPIQKKVEEFSKEEKVGDLNIINVEENEGSVDLEKESLGKLEVYKDKQDVYQESKKEIFKEGELEHDDYSSSKNDKDEDEDNIKEENPYKTRTDEIINELLGDSDEETTEDEKIDKTIDEKDMDDEVIEQVNPENQEIIENPINEESDETEDTQESKGLESTLEEDPKEEKQE